eukprot:SAG31_NODE_84_length_27014_cov_3.743006_2_plen_93_part_00
MHREVHVVHDVEGDVSTCIGLACFARSAAVPRGRMCCGRTTLAPPAATLAALSSRCLFFLALSYLLGIQGSHAAARGGARGRRGARLRAAGA